MLEERGSTNGDVLNDRACAYSVKGESFREQKNEQKTPPVSFSGSEKSAKRATASAAPDNPHTPKKKLPCGFKKYASARAAPPEE
jgi:hypothetical protein